MLWTIFGHHTSSCNLELASDNHRDRVLGFQRAGFALQIADLYLKDYLFKKNIFELIQIGCGA